MRPLDASLETHEAEACWVARNRPRAAAVGQEPRAAGAVRWRVGDRRRRGGHPQALAELEGRDDQHDGRARGVQGDLRSSQREGLRGAVLHPCRIFTLDGCAEPITRQDVQDLRDLGANLINASYPGLFSVQQPYEVDPAALTYLDNLVEWADNYRYLSSCPQGRYEFSY